MNFSVLDHYNGFVLNNFIKKDNSQIDLLNRELGIKTKNKIEKKYPKALIIKLLADYPTRSLKNY